MKYYLIFFNNFYYVLTDYYIGGKYNQNIIKGDLFFKTDTRELIVADNQPLSNISRKVIATNNYEQSIEHNLLKLCEKNCLEINGEINLITKAEWLSSEASLDFLGTGSNWKAAEKEENEWRNEFNTLIDRLIVNQHNVFSAKDMIEFHQWAFQQERIHASDKTTAELLDEWTLAKKELGQEVEFATTDVKPKGPVNVIRQLDDGELINWKCFWDNGWYDSISGIIIPGVISWEKTKIQNKNKEFLLKLK